MVEYNLEDAQALLSKNLTQAEKNLVQVKEDLAFIRDQCTTTEVSILLALAALSCSCSQLLCNALAKKKKRWMGCSIPLVFPHSWLYFLSLGLWLEFFL